ncbi:DUF4913 domain-containing protein [Marinactinospora thermotolerans]|uniref:DUF4913 domain-containing protein n=1 Tax=Marinactinospora thermotolerans DSM 45154 TaxID=1122192 RepID=A0A1T4SUV1_9ACTN|nr:DUF4913 domain-containing protein [Marinactinospora thermotolerans]SKA31959.1 protein of unknown function [Marinactinospora thermotolerans DSM 45154]
MTYTDDRVAADAGLTDRVALLQNAIHKLGADVIRLQTQLSELAATNAQRPEEPRSATPFIFNMSRDAYRGELASLVGWVDDFLVPVYLGSTGAWCPVWWEHHEAVGRLHALRLAYIELSDTSTAGPSGPGLWHRDHLDPTLDRLRSPDGPFAACLSAAGHVERRQAGHVERRPTGSI